MTILHQVDSEDASFLFSEKLDNPSHLSLVALYDQSPLAGRVVRFQNLCQLIDSRLQTAPVLKQRVKRITADLDYPYWVDDSRFDIDYHVRHLALPQPGDWRQFCIQVARLHSRPLDTRRPLWELYVIEGLNAVPGLPGGSFALYFKVHHCAMDTLTAMEFLESLHEAQPNLVQHEAVTPEVRHVSVRAPTRTEATLQSLWGNSLRLASLGIPPWEHYRRLARTVRSWAMQRYDDDGVLTPAGSAHFASTPQGPRVFEGISVSLHLFQRLAHIVPGSRLEHALTLICAEATRRYLLGRASGNPDHIVARIHLPARHAGAHALAGNAMALREVETYCKIDDALERLTAIANTVAYNDELAKEEQGRLLRARHEGLPAPLNRLLSRHSEHRERFGTSAEAIGIHLNHGPEGSLHLLGARLHGVTDLNPLLDGCSLVYSATTYNELVYLSFTSASEKLPDPRLLKVEIESVLSELSQVASEFAVE